MRIIACIRSLNEQDHIEKCCKSYAQFCDKVLIADGGSTDDTLRIAWRMPKVRVKHFTSTVQCVDGTKRNPDGPHLQFLWDWAIEEGADWIISQDCDQRPNKYLKEDARHIFETMPENKDFLLATQIFLWGETQYFPQLSGGPGAWMQGLWAWRANINLRVIDKMPHFEFSYDGKTSFDLNKTSKSYRIMPPYCYMHFGWETEEMADKQVQYYRKTKLIPGCAHPLDYGGPLADLTPWMVE